MSQEKIIVPKGWKEVKLSDKEYFLDIIGGGTPSRSNSEYFGGGIPWVRLADMKQKYISNTNETLTKKGLEKGSTLIPKNTIILSTRASIGKVAIAETELCTNQGFKSIVCDNEKVLPEFFYYFLVSIKSQLQRLGGATTFAEVNRTKLSNISVPIPPLPIQKQIIKNIKSAEEKFQSQKQQFQNIRDSYESTIKYIEHMQSSILDAAFSGKLVQ